ncbi:hypothetical protein ACFYMO_22370 [Streptomyces sp. NPDC007025]|uniref:hypothetical protein n=1 Tax=Streptomyces sp. NPDC007025 TaxID=3364771 RepID=UPI0036925570
MIAPSVTDEAWAAEVTSGTDGPYLFLAEAVLPHFDGAAVHQVVDLLADRFPGPLLALDTAGPGFFDTQGSTTRSAGSRPACVGTAQT